MVLPLRTLSTSLVPFFSRLAERSVTLTLRLMLRLVNDLLVPATRTFAISLDADSTGVRRVILQVAALREALSAHAARTASFRTGSGFPVAPRGPAGPAGPCPPGVLGSGVVPVLGAAETNSSSDVASPVPALLVANARQATRRPRSAAVSVYFAPVAPAIGVPLRSHA